MRRVRPINYRSPRSIKAVPKSDHPNKSVSELAKGFSRQHGKLQIDLQFRSTASERASSLYGLVVKVAGVGNVRLARKLLESGGYYYNTGSAQEQAGPFVTYNRQA